VTRLPPPSPCSSEDNIRIRAQLRPTFSRRRKTNTEEPTSGERPAPRRRAPVPMRVVLAGAGERTTHLPPLSLCSPEDSIRICAQLRLTFSRRRKTNTEEPTFGERRAPRRRAPAPMRVVLAGAGSAEDTLTSAEPLFAGGQHPNPCSAPANILSQEKDEYRRAHLRGEARSPEKSTSSYEGLLRRR
jgi:hypothetical protein